MVNRIDMIAPKGTQLTFTALYRIQITGMIPEESNRDQLVVTVKRLKEEPYDPQDKEIKAYNAEIVATIRDIMKIPTNNQLFRETLILQLNNQTDPYDPAELADLGACLTVAEGSQLQEVLEAMVVPERQKKALQLLKAELDLNLLQQKISK